MAVQVLKVETLPDEALEASAFFHSEIIPQIRRMAAQGAATGSAVLAIQLPAAAYDHDDWRRAVIRDLAREYAPTRCVILSGGCDTAIKRTLRYIANAPGITGQLLNLAGT